MPFGIQKNISSDSVTNPAKTIQSSLAESRVPQNLVVSHQFRHLKKKCHLDSTAFSDTPTILYSWLYLIQPAIGSQLDPCIFDSSKPILGMIDKYKRERENPQRSTDDD